MMRLLGLAAGIAALALSGAVLAQDASVKHYGVPGHGSLELKVPGSWRSQTRSRSEPPMAQLRLLPASGNTFDMQITAGSRSSIVLMVTSGSRIRVVL